MVCLAYFWLTRISLNMKVNLFLRKTYLTYLYTTKERRRPKIIHMHMKIILKSNDSQAHVSGKVILL